MLLLSIQAHYFLKSEIFAHPEMSDRTVPVDPIIADNLESGTWAVWVNGLEPYRLLWVRVMWQCQVDNVRGIS